MNRKFPSHPVVGVGAVVLHEGKLLLIKRGAEPGMGKWSIPGGVVELGENARDAVVREVKEECGLDIQLVADKPMDVVDRIVRDEEGRVQYHYVLLQFLARLKGGAPKPASDVLEAKWVPLGEVEAYDLTESFRLFFRKYRDEFAKL